jgi:peptidoglycan hydrolase-like protein with peptidoglycan-binding domain
MTGGSSVSQVKYLLQNKQYNLARKIILEYPHLFKRDYLLKNYPNLFTQEELNFISLVLGEKEVINQLVSQILEKQKQLPEISKSSKYQSLKEKLQQHPLKNELKNFRFKKVLMEGMRNKDIKYLQIILNLDNDTKIKDKGLGSFTNETEYFGYFTKQAVIKFQEKYKEDILKPINKDKGTGIVGIMTIMKLNEILEEIGK